MVSLILADPFFRLVPLLLAGPRDASLNLSTVWNLWWTLPLAASSTVSFFIAGSALYSAFNAKSACSRLVGASYLCLGPLAALTYIVASVPFIEKPPFWVSPTLLLQAFVSAGVFLKSTPVEG